MLIGNAEISEKARNIVINKRESFAVSLRREKKMLLIKAKRGRFLRMPVEYNPT